MGKGEPPDHDDLDAAMRVAWNKEGRVGSSVLAAIVALGGEVPRVLLREHAEADTPVVSSGSSDASLFTGPYQIVGELARGGVGIVLKGRDVDLGRDVALKVIREEHAQNPEVVRRFIR